MAQIFSFGIAFVRRRMSDLISSLIVIAVAMDAVSYAHPEN
jgi:hypothetical protein